jgi:hypothetical protein
VRIERSSSAGFERIRKMLRTANAVEDGAKATSSDNVTDTSAKHFSKPAPRALDLDFSFVPKSLAEKCRRLIETYHAMHGYACLPDMLWQPELRDFIEMQRDFQQIFKRASTARSAKRANEGFVLIATTVLSLEVLASDFASWSVRYPAAKRRADAILQEYTLNSRTWLMDRYLYPRSYINPAFINALAPPEGAHGRDLMPEVVRGGRSSATVIEESA